MESNLDKTIAKVEKLVSKIDKKMTKLLKEKVILESALDEMMSESNRRHIRN